MKKYELIVENVVNAYILDKEENKIVALCSTKRPDLEFEKLKELVEKANEYDTLKETNLKLFNDMKKVMEVPHFVNQENVKLKLQNRELTEKIEQLEADLRGKDNEIDILKLRIKCLSTSKTKNVWTPTKKGVE